MVLLSSSVLAATWVVDSSGNIGDDNVGDGICRVSGTNGCTLAAAIQEANNAPGPDVITFDWASQPTWEIRLLEITVEEDLLIDGGLWTGLAMPNVVLDGQYISFSPTALVVDDSATLTLTGIELSKYDGVPLVLKGPDSKLVLDGCRLWRNEGRPIVAEDGGVIQLGVDEGERTIIDDHFVEGGVVMKGDGRIELNNVQISFMQGPAVLTEGTVVVRDAHVHDNIGGIYVVPEDLDPDTVRLHVAGSDDTEARIEHNAGTGIYVRSGEVDVDSLLIVDDNGGWGITAEDGFVRLGGELPEDQPMSRHSVSGNGLGFSGGCYDWEFDGTTPEDSWYSCTGGGILSERDVGEPEGNKLFEVDITDNRLAGVRVADGLVVGGLTVENNLGHGIALDDDDGDERIRFAQVGELSEVRNNLATGVFSTGSIDVDRGITVDTNGEWGLYAEHGSVIVGGAVPADFPDSPIVVTSNASGGIYGSGTGEANLLYNVEVTDNLGDGVTFAHEVRGGTFTATDNAGWGLTTTGSADFDDVDVTGNANGMHADGDLTVSSGQICDNDDEDATAGGTLELSLDPCGGTGDDDDDDDDVTGDDDDDDDDGGSGDTKDDEKKGCQSAPTTGWALLLAPLLLRRRATGRESGRGSTSGAARG